MTDQAVAHDQDARFIDRKHLYQRILLAVAVLLIPLFAASVVSVAYHRSAAINARYVVAMSQLVEGMARLDGYIAQIEAGREPNRTEVENAFANALGLFAAMRAADPDGHEIMDEKGAAKREKLSEITTAAGIDPEEIGARLGLVGHEMPEDLETIWEEEDDWISSFGDAPSLEAAFAGTLLASAPIIVDDLRDPVAFDRYWLTSNRLPREQLTEVASVLQTASTVASRMPLILSTVVLGIAFGGAVFAWFFVVRPLIREILHTQAALAREAEAAKAADLAKSDFLANVSHELRTPLNGIVGLAELLEDQNLDDEGREMLATLQTSGTELGMLVNALLDITRIESGDMKIEREPFDPSFILRQTSSLISPQANQKGLTTDVEVIPSPFPEVMGDQHAFRQICLNLLGNAVKFTEEGEVSASLELEPVAGRQMLTLKVADTGIGIAEADQKRIFERFVRTQDGVNIGASGTGLGLPIVRAMIEMMNGSIDIESLQGEGTTFTIRIPTDIAAHSNEKRAA